MPSSLDPLKHSKAQESTSKMIQIAGKQNLAVLSTGSQQQGHAEDNDVSALQLKLDLNNDK